MCFKDAVFIGVFAGGSSRIVSENVGSFFSFEVGSRSRFRALRAPRSQCEPVAAGG